MTALANVGVRKAVLALNKCCRAGNIEDRVSAYNVISQIGDLSYLPSLLKDHKAYVSSHLLHSAIQNAIISIVNRAPYDELVKRLQNSSHDNLDSVIEAEILSCSIVKYGEPFINVIIREIIKGRMEFIRILESCNHKVVGKEYEKLGLKNKAFDWYIKHGLIEEATRIKELFLE